MPIVTHHRWTATGIVVLGCCFLGLSPATAQVYLVEDINSIDTGIGYFEAAVLGTKILFPADDGIHGSELWISDGTPGGTDLLMDIWLPGTPDPTGEFSSGPRNFVSTGGLVYFTAYSGEAAVDDPWYGMVELFASDGTPEGTTALAAYPLANERAVMGGSLYFIGWDESSGYELRRATGTTVSLVKEITPGSSSSSLGDFAVVDFDLYGDRLVFYAFDDDHGVELWMSDGTSGGTAIVKDIADGINEHGNPREMIGYDGRVFFSAHDDSNDTELWVSDGTEGGTNRFLEINTTGNSSPHDFFVAGGLLYFVAYDGSAHHLWATDGTVGGTVAVLEIDEHLYNNSYNQGAHADFDGKFFFANHHEDHGTELWVSDGTPGGTGLFQDIYPGFYDVPGGGQNANDSMPYDFEVAGGFLFFTARDDSGLGRLYVCDGTVDGTVAVAPQDQPYAKIEAGSLLFFVATEDLLGRELHALPLPDIVTAPNKVSGETACNTGIPYGYTTGGAVSLNGNRVQYRFHWGDEGNSGWLDWGVTSADHVWTTEADHIVTAEARAETTGTTSSRSQSLWVQVVFEEIIDDPVLSGPALGGPDISYAFTLEGGSNGDHALEYSFDWQDGSPIVWLPFDSETGSVQASHSWQNLGDFEVHAKIRCSEHTDLFSEAFHWISLQEEAIVSVNLSGPSSGYTDHTYHYTISGESTWGHDLEYAVSWGDGSPGIDWTPFPAGQNTATVSHAWDFEASDFPMWAGVRCAAHTGVENGDDMTVAIADGPAGLLFSDGFETADTTQW